MKKIIQQGAEAIISLEKNQITKERISKSYRLPIIDKRLRKSRTKSEAKIINKLSEIINVPKIIESDNQENILMEFINGKKLSEHLEKLNWKIICKELGKSIAKIHNQDIIHGDLTTSNMMLKDKELYLIDYGLGFHSRKIEDKAVDLHLLKQALEAKHFDIAREAIKIILNSYNASQKPLILERIKKIESRGRYKGH